MGHVKFDKKYQIILSGEEPSSPVIYHLIQSYLNEFKVKPKNKDSLHIERFDPDQKIVNDRISKFGQIQADMLDDIFDAFDSMQVSDSAYNEYFSELKAMVSSWDAHPEQSTFTVYQHTTRSLSEKLLDLEKYLDSVLIPKKTINSDEIKDAIKKHRELHANLYVESWGLYVKTENDLKTKITDDADKSDLFKASEMRLHDAKIHSELSVKLNPLTLTPTQTISEEDYNYIKNNLGKRATQEEIADNNKIITIAKSMITIAPGFDKIRALIDVSIKDFSDRLLTAFMFHIAQRISMISDQMNNNQLGIAKMVLMLNIYLKIFRDIVPKLPLVSHKGVIRYNKINYSASEIFSDKKLNDAYPDELKAINLQYADALVQLKLCTKKFILKLVSEINSKIIEFRNNPSELLANEIMERVAGHTKCLKNYQYLFNITDTKDLTLFILDEYTFDSSSNLIYHLIADISNKGQKEILDYKVMDDDKQLKHHIVSYVYFRQAHNAYYINSNIEDLLKKAHVKLHECFNFNLDSALKKLTLIKPFAFDLNMRHMLFLNDTFGPYIENYLNIKRRNPANLIFEMIQLILTNTHYKNSRVVYDDISKLVDDTKVDASVRELLKHIMINPDHSIESLTLHDYLKEYKAYELSEFQMSIINAIVKQHRSINCIDFGSFIPSKSDLTSLLTHNPHVLRVFSLNSFAKLLGQLDYGHTMTHAYDKDSASFTLTRNNLKLNNKSNISDLIRHHHHDAELAYKHSLRVNSKLNLTAFIDAVSEIHEELSAEFIHQVFQLSLDEYYHCDTDKMLLLTLHQHTHSIALHLQEFCTLLVENLYVINTKKAPNRLRHFANDCESHPYALTPAQYETMIATLAYAYEQAENKEHVECIKDVLPPLLSAYLASFDKVDHYTNIHALINCYKTIEICMTMNNDGTFERLSRAETFINNYTIKTVLGLLEKASLDQKSQIIAKISHIHHKWGNYILTRSTLPSRLVPFMNHMSILINNEVAPVIEEPLGVNHQAISVHKSSDLANFLKYLCFYISRFNNANDFVKNLSKYIDHMLSYGLALNEAQANMLIHEILILDASPFKRMQSLSIRMIALLPVTAQDSPLSTNIQTLFITAVQLNAEELIEALLDDDKVYLLLTQKMIDSYKPEQASNLTTASKDILSHFDHKIRDKNLTHHSQNIDRLNKQMKKLDKVMLLLTQLTPAMSSDSKTFLFTRSIAEIANLENSLKSFFNSQSGLSSSLCKPLADLSKESLSPENINALKTELSSMYDRLITIMTGKFIQTLKSEPISHEKKISHLKIVFEFMTERQYYLCNSLDMAVAKISNAINKANAISGIISTSYSKSFLKNMTPHCILYKDDYKHPMMLLADAIAALGGTRPSLDAPNDTHLGSNTQQHRTMQFIV